MPAATPSAPLTLHGVFMDVFDVGVLLTGVSGVGKSELALELLARGHRLVADDATEFMRQGERITGTCPPLLEGFLEARSLGILNIRKLYGDTAVIRQKALDLMIELDAPRRGAANGLERLSGNRQTRPILGQDVPLIGIPIRLGHNLAVLVEAACRDFSLRRGGYSADDDFMSQQLDQIRKTKTGGARGKRRTVRA